MDLWFARQVIRQGFAHRAPALGRLARRQLVAGGVLGLVGLQFLQQQLQLGEFTGLPLAGGAKALALQTSYLKLELVYEGLQQHGLSTLPCQLLIALAHHLLQQLDVAGQIGGGLVQAHEA